LLPIAVGIIVAASYKVKNKQPVTTQATLPQQPPQK